MLSSASSRGVLRTASNLLIAAGLLLLSFAGLYYAYTLYTQYQLTHFPINETLEIQASAAPPPGTELREEPPVFPPSAVPSRVMPDSRPPATHIAIPSIGIDASIVELGTTYDENGELVWETPKHAVGHHLGTAQPGEPGNVVLSGHISSPIKKEGNVFSRLPQLKLGEQVTVTTPEGLHTYKVVSRKVVEPSAIGVMAPTPAPTLTLITCYPDWVYSHRMVLTAEPVDFQTYND